jgi:phosphatidate cytidylyltransferase
MPQIIDNDNEINDGKQSLQKRIIVAVIGIPIIFACIYVGGWWFFAFMFLVNFFCIREYVALCEKYNPHKFLTFVLELLFFVGLPLTVAKEYFPMLYCGAIISVLFLLFLVEVMSQKVAGSVARIAVSFLGIMFFPLSFMFMILLSNMFLGWQYLLLLFITTWILDTCAYAVGRKYGKRKLAQYISPKKTREGAVAGLIGGIITALIINHIFGMFDYYWQAAILGLAIALVGQFSDLAESVIKRDADIKDSGALIPGHGGALDRFDSYLFAAPVVYFLIVLLKGSSY